MPEECIVIKQKWKYKNEIFNINPILHFKEMKLKISSFLYLSLVKRLNFDLTMLAANDNINLYVPLF